MQHDVSGIRELLGKKTGEIIEGLIGTDALKRMYDDKAVPAELKGLAAGDIALRMGLISPAVKEALLIAQAAERTVRLVEALEAPAAQQQAHKSLNDPDFKWIGSAKDSARLQYAQGLMMHAQSIVNDAHAPLYMGMTGKGLIVQQAVECCTEASALLAKEGYGDAAAKIGDVAQGFAQQARSHKTGNRIVQKRVATLLAAKEAGGDLDATLAFTRLFGVHVRTAAKNAAQPTV